MSLAILSEQGLSSSSNNQYLYDVRQVTLSLFISYILKKIIDSNIFTKPMNYSNDYLNNIFPTVALIFWG